MAKTSMAQTPPETQPIGSVQIDSIPSVHSISSEGIEFAVENLIPMSAVTMLAGEAGGGKTTFAMALAAHAACGATILGRECAARSVLVLDRENTLPIVQERCRRQGIQDGNNLRIWGSWLADEAPSPGSSMLLEYVERSIPKPLIVVDSLIAFLDGDENDASVVRPFMHQLRRLADLGAGVLILHHTGKSETTKNYRGSSDLKASIDIGLNLVSKSIGILNELELKPFKTRFLVDADLRIRYDNGEFICLSQPVHMLTVTERLAALLKQNPGINTRRFQELATAQRLGRDRARDFLRESGFVRTVEDKANHNTYQHFLITGPQEFSDVL